MNIVSIKEAAKLSGVEYGTIYQRILNGKLKKYSVINNNGRTLIGVSMDEMLTYFPNVDIVHQANTNNPISIYSAAKLLGVTYWNVQSKIKTKNIPTQKIMGKNGNEVIGIKMSDFYAAYNKSKPAETVSDKNVIKNGRKYVLIMTDDIEDIKSLFV